MRTPADAHAMLGDVMKSPRDRADVRARRKDDAITWTAEEPATIGKALGDYRYERTGDQYVVGGTDAATRVHAVVIKHAPDSERFTRLTFTRDGLRALRKSPDVDVRVAHAQEG
ncbi:MAG: hypothetical protein KF782_24095 [Labilithrix sp.]|nr:hypothetical protein [Labilithrix sp.]